MTFVMYLLRPVAQLCIPTVAKTKKKNKKNRRVQTYHTCLFPTSVNAPQPDTSQLKRVRIRGKGANQDWLNQEFVSKVKWLLRAFGG